MLLDDAIFREGPVTAHRRGARRTVAATVALVAGITALWASPAFAGAPSTPWVAYVTNHNDGTVTPIRLSTNSPQTPIAGGTGPEAIAITPDAKTVYAAAAGGSTLTAIDVASGQTSTPLTASSYTSFGDALAFLPDGTRAYVAAGGSVLPVGLPGGQILTPTSGFTTVTDIAVSPDGKAAYAVDSDDNIVTPIDVASGQARTPIPVGIQPWQMAITPDGKYGFVTDLGNNVMTTIDLASGRATWTTSDPSLNQPLGIAITPDGTKALVTNWGSNTVTVFDVEADGTLGNGTSVAVASAPRGVAITPDGKYAYVVDESSNEVTPIDLATDTALTPIAVGNEPIAIAITPDPAPTAAFTTSGVSAPGQPVTFDGSGSAGSSYVDAGIARPDRPASTAGIASYQWNFGDGTSATTTTPTTTHTYASPGNYSPTLTVTDTAGCSSAQTWTGHTASCAGGSGAAVSHQIVLTATTTTTTTSSTAKSSTATSSTTRSSSTSTSTTSTATVPVLPPAPRYVFKSERHLTFHDLGLPRGVRLRSETLFVNGRRIRVLHRGPVAVSISFAGRVCVAGGNTMQIAIVSVTRRGKVYRVRRTLHLCRVRTPRA